MQKVIFTLATALVLSLQLSAQAKLKVLHNFGVTNDGSPPSGPLAFDSRGNLYGVTTAGGQHGYGTVYELTAQKNGSWREQVLYSFLAGSNGAYPGGALLVTGPAGLYGTAEGYS